MILRANNGDEILITYSEFVTKLVTCLMYIPAIIFKRELFMSERILTLDEVGG